MCARERERVCVCACACACARVCERVKVADDDNNDIDGMYIRVHS